MDKNTIAGLVIIFLILIGFSYFTRPSKEQVAEMQRKQDCAGRPTQSPGTGSTTTGTKNAGQYDWRQSPGYQK